MSQPAIDISEHETEKLQDAVARAVDDYLANIDYPTDHEIAAIAIGVVRDYDRSTQYVPDYMESVGNTYCACDDSIMPPCGELNSNCENGNVAHWRMSPETADS